MDKHFTREAAKELIRELCRLVDSGVFMGRDEFHDLCAHERFIDALFMQHKGTLHLEYLNAQSPLCKDEVLDYVNNAFDRHANAIVMENYGLKNNALLMAVNFCVSILDEVDAAK